MARISASRIALLPVDDRQAVVFAEELVQHLPETKQLSLVDANRQDSARLQHGFHHSQARKHEAHPLRAPSSVVGTNEFPQIRVVRILFPLVVVSEIVARVVGRVREYEIHMPLLTIKG